MKHVFIINAHTPYLTALGVIDKLNLNNKDVIFVLGRNYKCFDKRAGITIYDLSSLYDYRLTLFNKHRTLRRLGEVKKFIDSNIIEEYTLYLPHLNYYYFQVFAKHPLCKDIKLIEEGIVDFCKDESIPETLSLKSRFINFYMFRNTWFWNSNRWNTYIKLKDKKISETFAITDKLYTNIPCTHTVVQWPHMVIQKELDENATFFVFDSLVEQKIVDFDSYIRVSERFIEKYKGRMNYIKFHPYQQENVKSEILSIFEKNGDKVEVLPNDIPFEMILCNKQHLKVCGFTTSLVYYAFLMGHEAHIYMKDFFEIPSFCSYWNRFEKSLCMYGDIFKYDEL